MGWDGTLMLNDGAASSAYFHAEQLLRFAREELDRADSKASILLAGCGVGVGALLHFATGGRSDGVAALYGSVQWLWWIGIAGIGAGILSLAGAIYPRQRHQCGSARLVTYYGDVVATHRLALDSRLARCGDDIFAVTNDQLHQISTIVTTKYRHIRRALWLFALSGPFVLGAGILQVLAS